MRNVGALLWGALIAAATFTASDLWGFGGAVAAVVVCGLAWGAFERLHGPADD